MSVTVCLESFENETRRNPMGYTCFDDPPRLEMSDKAPNGPHQSCVAVVPPLERLRPRIDAVLGGLFHYHGPQIPECSARLARPGQGKPLVHMPLPVLVGLILATRPASLSPLDVVVLHCHQDLYGIRSYVDQTVNRMFQQVTNRDTKHGLLLRGTSELDKHS